MSHADDKTARRTFLSRLGLGVGAIGLTLGAAGLGARPATAQHTAQNTTQPGALPPRRHPQDAWMDKPDAAHRIVIDSAFPAGGGAALLYANNNFLANASGYGLEAKDIAIIVVLRHLSTPFAFSDAIWSKYGETLSTIIDFKDPRTSKAPVVNVYNAPVPGLPNRGVTIPTLVEKNVQFAVCASATRVMAGGIAQSVKGQTDAIFAELEASLVPNARLVPAGVLAVNRAQEYGYTLLTAV